MISVDCSLQQHHLDSSLSETQRPPGWMDACLVSALGKSQGLMAFFFLHACVSAGRKQFARHEWAQKAAYLLGCTLEELSSCLFKHQAKGTLPRASSVRQAADENGTADAGIPHIPLVLHSPLVPHTHAHTQTQHVDWHTSVCSSPKGNCMLNCKHGRSKAYRCGE